MSYHKYEILFIYFVLISSYSSLFAAVNNTIDSLRPTTGVSFIPARIMTGVTAQQYDGSPLEAATEFISKHSAQIGINSVGNLKYIKTIRSLSDYHVSFQQFYQDIPVHNAHINVSINKENKIGMVVENILSDINISTVAVISDQEAVNSVFRSVEGVLEPDKINALIEKCIVYDVDTIPKIAWKIRYYSKKYNAQVRVFVNGANAEIMGLERTSMNYENGKGLVFKPDPISKLMDSSLRDQNNADNMPGSTYVIVDLLDLNDPNLAGEYCLQGKYARSEDKSAPNTSLVSKVSANDFSFNRSEVGFEEVNAYFFIDHQRRYIGSLGFEPKFGSNQDDALVFDAHGMNGDYGGAYSFDLNGEPFIEFGDGWLDAAEDQDVILHEYTHAVHDALMIGDGIEASADQDEISEGSGDYLAVSFRHTLSMYQPGRVFPWHWNDEYVIITSSPARYVIDQNTNDPNIYPNKWIGRYEAGTVWGSSVMDLETDVTFGVGRDVATTLLLKSFSYIDLSSYAPDNVYALMTASREHLDSKQLASLGFVFERRGFFMDRWTNPNPPAQPVLVHESHYLSGDITEYTEWSNMRWIYDDVIINSNVTVDPHGDVFIFIGAGQSIVIESGATLRLDTVARMVIYENATILVKNGGSLLIEDEAAIILHGGSIICEGNGQVILENSRAIRGSGYISSANLTWIRGMNLQEGESIIFQNGGVFNFDCTQANRPQYILNSGNVAFEGSANEYVFGSCLDEIRIHSSGTFVTEAGVTLQNLPTLISWDNAVLQSHGTQQDPCAWMFRSGAGLEDYTSLVATRTTFGGSTLSGMPPEEWEGILVGDVSSWIDLDYCTVQDVFADLANSGTGIHFYQSGAQYISRIRNSRILRNTGGQNKHGDGIFLQPGSAFSYVKLECSEINQDWYTGFTSVGSYPRVFDSKIMSNLVGVGLSVSSILTMQRSCVEGHVYEGIDVDASELSFASLGTAGGNRVVDNANQQLDVHNGSVVYGGWDPAGGSNFEGHDNNISSASQAWVANVDGSTAFLQQNWFGVVPDINDPVTGFCYLSPTQAASLFNGTTIHYDPAHCSEILPNCSTECAEFFQNPGGVASFSNPASLPRFASGLPQLRAYARVGNFAEVYRFVGTMLPNTVSGPQAKRYASFLMHLENEHVRNNPDTLAVSRSRLNAFLLTRFSASHQAEAKAAILNVLARSLFALEDISGADYRISQLRNQYANSPYALDILPVLQLVAMAQRDSVKMNNAMSLMQSANFSADEMRLARTMKRAYHRFRPQSPYPKSVFYSDEHEALPPTSSLVVKNYPNPFNPSTVLEYILPESGHVTLLVFDVLGRPIAKLVNEEQVAGVHTAVFDAGNSPSGIYMYVLTTPSGQVSGKMLLAR